MSKKKCDRLMIAFLHLVCMLRLIVCVIASSEMMILFVFNSVETISIRLIRFDSILLWLRRWGIHGNDCNVFCMCLNRGELDGRGELLIVFINNSGENEWRMGMVLVGE